MKYLTLMLLLLLVSCSDPQARKKQAEYTGNIMWREKPKSDVGGEVFIVENDGIYKVIRVTHALRIWKKEELTFCNKTTRIE